MLLASVSAGYSVESPVGYLDGQAVSSVLEALAARPLARGVPPAAEHAAAGAGPALGDRGDSGEGLARCLPLSRLSGL